MKKIGLYTLIAAFAIVVLSSFVRLTHQLESKLARNQDFQKWTSGMISLKSTINKTHSQEAFTKFLTRTNTAIENDALAKNLGYQNASGLTAAFDKINTFRNNFIKATPELQTSQAEKLYTAALETVVPTCQDVYDLAQIHCFNLYLTGDTPDYNAYDQCVNTATIAYIHCMIDPPVED